MVQSAWRMEMTKMVFLLLACVSAVALGHNSYTAGYSGSPGRQRCASSCHGGTAGTLTVSGFPSSYQPQQQYTITVRHNGGSPIVNFNGTVHTTGTATVAGTFAAATNTTLYTGADGGVYASPHAIDSAVFRWTAPVAGTGSVTLYLSGFQGTTSSSNGQSTTLTFASSEITTGVKEEGSQPQEFTLSQNYPNPFNPTTTIAFTVPQGNKERVRLLVFDAAGKLVATLADRVMQAGDHRILFDASQLASGIYFYRLETGVYTHTRKSLLVK